MNTLGGAELGRMFVSIFADDSKFRQTIDADLKKMQSMGNNLEAQSKKIGNTMAGIGRNMTQFVTLPAVAAGAAMLKAGMNFEEGMSNIKALGGETAESMKQLHDMALEMGAKTKYSAVEAAQGIEELRKAGVTTAQVLGGGLEGTLALAAAGEIEVAQAAIVASTAINAFKKDSLSVMQSADILAGAANASATDIQGLALGLAQASAVAAGMGMTFEDTATGLAVFAQNGLKGSDAGTSLKTMMMNLQPVSDKQIKQFERLNLLDEEGNSLFYDKAGKMKKLSEISGLLNTSLSGLTDAERAMALEVMFGSDAIRAGNILFAEGAAGITKMHDAMGETTAVEVAREKQNNLKGSVENMIGSLETLAVKIYEMQQGPLKKLIDGITKLINVLGNMNPVLQQCIVIFIGLLAAMGPVLWIAGKIIANFNILIGAFRTTVTVGRTVATAMTTIGTTAGTAAGGVSSLGLAFLAAAGYIGIFAGAIAGAIAWAKRFAPELADLRAQLDPMSTVADQYTGALSTEANADVGNLQRQQWGYDVPEDAPSAPTVKDMSWIEQKLNWFDTGGIVPGPLGAPQLAVVHGGEEVLTPAQRQGGAGVMNHTGTIRVEGVNNANELVGIAEILADNISRNDRRLPSRVSLVPI